MKKDTNTENLPVAAPQLGLVPASAGNLDVFIAQAYKLPMLSADEERALAIRFREQDDLAAAHKLVVHNLRFVIQIARSYCGYGLPLADLIQEGNVGLMKAVKRFNPHAGVRLISFAAYWIRAEIHEFILRNWRIVKVATTKAQRKLFFNLRKMKKRLSWFNQDEVQEVSDQLGVKPEEVVEMESRLAGQDVSFDPVVSGNEDDSPATPADYLPGHAIDPEQEAESDDWKAHCRRKLDEALGQLDERSLDILKARWFSEKKATLQVLAAKHQVSAERIRQIENKAIQQLREHIAAS